jgi:N-succinyldiaminopimelate aminotransferase
VCADVRPLGFADGLELCRALPSRIGVAAVPVQVFTDNPADWAHVVRFAFCKRDSVLDEALQRLHQLA